MSLTPAMSSFRVRPHFAHTVELGPDETRTRILQAFANNRRVLK